MTRWSLFLQTLSLLLHHFLGLYCVVEGQAFTVRATVTAEVSSSGIASVTVDWGDGTSGSRNGGTGASGAGLVSVSHSYTDDGTYGVSICATDRDGFVACDTAEVSVTNSPPVADSVNPTGGLEGGASQVVATFADSGGADTHSYTVDWGDGATDGGVAIGPISSAHVFSNDGTYSARVCITDDDGGTGCTAAMVTVANAAPTIDAGPDLSGLEGTTIALDAKIEDSGVADTHTVTVDWGDGTSEAAEVDQAGRTAVASHTYSTSGSYTATVCAQDDAGADGCDSVSVEVTNAAPIVSVTLDAEHVGEGQAVTVSGTFEDPGSNESHTASVDWGDGTISDASLYQGRLTAVHAYGDNGIYAVRVCVADSDGAEGCRLATSRVTNSSPTLNVLGNRSIEAYLGRSVRLSTGFSDRGRLDSHSATVDWGDGTSSVAGITVISVGDGSVVARASGSHGYSHAGTYSVRVDLVDDDGGLLTYYRTVVVSSAPTGHAFGY